MRINFFEEYPTEENMSKLDLINWSSTILLTAPSLKEFENIRAKYSVKYPHITFGWWPTIPGSYWVSAIANPSDLERLFLELTSKVHEKELPVLIDLELPITKHLYFKNIFHIWSNKKRISKFFIEAPNFNLKLYTAEYPAFNKLLYQIWKLLGISPSFKFQHTKLPMVYSSVWPKYFGNKIWEGAKNFEKRFVRKNYRRVGFGIGTIALGVLGNEPILKPQDLKVDITWAKECGVDEVFIFRLGGINKDYKLILDEFIAK